MDDDRSTLDDSSQFDQWAIIFESKRLASIRGLIPELGLDHRDKCHLISMANSDHGQQINQL
jgi:hypothetical protein